MNDKKKPIEVLVDTPTKQHNSNENNNRDDDDEIQICSPPPSKKLKANYTNNQDISNDDIEDSDDDAPQVLSTTVVNPNVDYPHKRVHCGVHPFTMQNAQRYCELCYCVVCDQPAKDCREWNIHCTAKPIQKDKSISTGEVTVLEDDFADSAIAVRLAAQNMHQLQRQALPQTTTTNQYSRNIMEDAFLRELAAMRRADSETSTSSRRRQQNQKSRSDKRITEILAENLRKALHLSHVGMDAPTSPSDDHFDMHDLYPTPNEESLEWKRMQQLKMEGDIPRLRLHNSFFVQGIRIGWPFPKIMIPQRQMAIHIIKALQKKLHVVLESPTGTGKSAAILCSVLAWQRHHAQTNKSQSSSLSPQKDSNDWIHKQDKREVGEKEEQDVPTIIYCSRTHSQVAQMVASLQKTPYRPRITVLGSRERLCINQEIRQGQKGTSLNNLCRERKIETDKRRKDALKSKSSRVEYNDDNPPSFQETDSLVPEEDGEDTNQRRKKKPTCRHYQQLTTRRTASMTQERFLWNAEKVNSCCSKGGEHTKAGVMDIEDLVAFGKDPYKIETIAMYRPSSDETFGLIIGPRMKGGCEVVHTKPQSVASKDGSLTRGDWILTVNGQNVRNETVDKISELIRESKTDPLRLKIQRSKSPSDGMELDTETPSLSSHAACPYYLSRALIPTANLIFAPYNYVLDPSIRTSLKLDLKGSVVVLDEAHNIEDTLCESGSGDYGEFDLCHLITALAKYSNQKGNKVDADVDLAQGGKLKLSEIAHELLLFLEELVMYMHRQRTAFQNGPMLANVKTEHERFRLPDDHSIEVLYKGPTGFGLRGEAIGCKPALKDLNVSPERSKQLNDYAISFENHLFGEDSVSDAILNNLVSLVGRFELAANAPEHFYIACNIMANGNMDFATERLREDEYATMIEQQRWRKHPKTLPLTSPRTEAHKNVTLQACKHKPCKSTNDHGYIIGQAVRHGEMCNGDLPRWEAHLVLRLLSPGILMKNIASECRSIVLASGSLAPLQSLCSELSLYGPKSEEEGSKTLSPVQKVAPSPKLTGRLQIRPKPLEANHVIDLGKQLFSCAIGSFPDGSPLTVSYSKYKDPMFFPRFGHALATVVESVPSGGVLVFFPSYSFLNKCVKCWNPRVDQLSSGQATSPQIWTRFMNSKGKVIVEATGSQEKFEAARDAYTAQIKETKKCLLLAVYRGKMSEGISFNDDNARAVICVGLPFPSSFDRAIKAKKSYNEEQRKIRKNTHLLPGNEWYSQQAYRAVAQALGRCIRHGADYGAVILMDSRYCDDGSPNTGVPYPHKNLPKWMRHSVRTLSMRPTSGKGQNPVTGGFVGLGSELRRFFLEAPRHSKKVLETWKSDLERSQLQSSSERDRTFDKKTCSWVSTNRLP